MKILHFADLHLGVENYGRTDPATGLSSRFNDFLSALDQVVDYAIDERVDLVLFCGDAYKTREPTQTQQREFARRISRLSASDVALFLLVGNHDLPNALGRATATEIFDTLSVRNVYVSSRPEVVRVQTRSGVVQVASLPWLRRSVLLSKEEAKSLGFDQVKQKMEQALTEAVNRNISRLDPALPSVLCGHVWMAGASPGSEKQMGIGQDPALLLSSVAVPAFDYVALGHIHRHQVLYDSPPVVYSGSLERVDFSEEADDKGFYVVEIGQSPPGVKRPVSYAFHPVKGRRFLTVSVDIDPQDIDPTGTVLRAIAGKAGDVREAVVRVGITLPEQMQAQLRDDAIREALKEAHYYAVVRDLQREVRLRMGQVAVEELTPLEALKKFLEWKKTPDGEAKQLIEYGERLIAEQVAGPE
ncbi:MAG: exonuclease SbcCD subunit D [Chloroflexi bacterium]|nr:exonuclease SbcCD subunit D [Chloroflexota bacterium]